MAVFNKNYCGIDMTIDGEYIERDVDLFFDLNLKNGRQFFAGTNAVNAVSNKLTLTFEPTEISSIEIVTDYYPTSMQSFVPITVTLADDSTLLLRHNTVYENLTIKKLHVAQTNIAKGVQKSFTLNEIKIMKKVVKIPNEFNKVQITSQNYEDECVVRKDYIGTLEDCSLASIDVLETSNKVSNNEVKDYKIRTISDDKFILE